MKEEFQRGCAIVDDVMLGKAEWSALFVKHDFFQRYRFYLQVVAASRDLEMQNKWSGTVASKIRQLVMRLEYVDALKLAHPFIKGFDVVYYCLSEEEAQVVSRGEIPEAVAQRKKEDVADKEGVIAVHTTSFFIGLSIKPKEAGSTGPRRLDISYPTTEFVKMTKMWEKYDESAMHIAVRHIKQFVYRTFMRINDQIFEHVILVSTVARTDRLRATIVAVDKRAGAGAAGVTSAQAA
ncbi:Poly(A) polymerase pla1 [Trametes pubescens]|uniref:Poly(A) polymerase pla1 n=1 Tax=Trametes pubescens TaxID=154538 RepID=A0A1M2VCN2_TRAPU|nr:Poly(A) polymerase pla1 [Trametes pubescens]